MPLLAMLLDERSRSRPAPPAARPRVAEPADHRQRSRPHLRRRQDDRVQVLPVLFLPIAWAAARQGLAGAALTIGLTQIGVVLATQLLSLSPLTLIELEVLVLVLALSGFFIGVVVDEKQRLNAELQQTLRLAAAGEMAGALSHELHQPLTALLAYTPRRASNCSLPVKPASGCAM
ncbi:MAG: hypothetical protein V5B38_01760 [Candidatus Accumulibacter propinquus]